MFSFDQYTVRPVGEKDRENLVQLITADPYHRANMDSNFFLKLVPGEDAWAIENRLGMVSLYFKTSTACRVAVQFGNQSSNENRDVLTKGLGWLEAALIQNKFRELIFDTEGAALRAMAKRRLGFKDASPGTLVRLLSTPIPTNAVKGDWHHRPTAPEEGGDTHVRS